jgi:ABC-type multidrug transport system fused ATPase/permease subunit
MPGKPTSAEQGTDGRNTSGRARPLRNLFQFNESLFDPVAWRFFYEYFQGKVVNLLGYAVVASLHSLLVVPVVFLIRNIFDVAIPEGDIQALFVLGSGILLIRVTMSLMKLGMRRYVLGIVKNAVHLMRCALIDNLYSVSRAFYSRAHQDQIHTRIVQDTERVDLMSNKLLSVMLPSGITAAALVIVLLALNWKLVLAGCMIFPLLWWATRLTGRRVKKSVYVFQRAFEVFSGGVQFVLNQMDLTRQRAFETEETKRQRAHTKDLRDKGVRMAMSYAINGEVQSNITGLGGLVILIIGGASIAAGDMTLGEFVSFYVTAGLLNAAVNQILVGLPDVITGNESLVTLTRLFDGYDEDPYQGQLGIDRLESLQLRDIDFSYGRTKVLQQVSLDVEPESNIAIVGENGAGKTTLIGIMLGFHVPDAGSIRANGIDYQAIDVRQLRKLVGSVPQQPSFFSGSVLENITYGVPDTTPQDLREVTRLALLDDIIESLPDGLETEIGDDGVRLSGGARQRIAIARALLGRPSLLILDEPTNHLDMASVERLMAGLTSWSHRPAIITISHDACVVEHADEVYRLRNGRLVRDSSEPKAVGASGA